MSKMITINGISHTVEAVNLAVTAEQIAELFGGTVQDRPEWYDAKPGEVWEVMWDYGSGQATSWMIVDPTGRFGDHIYEFDVTDPCIVHAEQVYPDLFGNPNR